MTMKDNEEIIENIMSELDGFHCIDTEEIPGIDLYMDQVTSFMNKHLKETSRNPETDKILTKTMINNYAKNHLLPSPEKKKYSKDHMIMLIFIYYFKGVLSLGDIRQILDPVMGDSFQTGSEPDLETIYKTVFSEEPEEIINIKKDITAQYERAGKHFNEFPEFKRDKLQMFSLICMMSYDVYMKKLIIERILDMMNEDDSTKTNAKTSAKTD
jgi:hypothetical protein